ncbi:hypothetical protein BJX76DRAFT_330176 [Aspergillus varians]
MGKNSEITWMQRLESEAMVQTAIQPQPHGNNSISSVNYRLDHNHLSDPEVKNAFVLPPKPLADKLCFIYFQKVHKSLPIIRECLFMEQYGRLFANTSLYPGRKWLAIFNLVLAISSRFCRYSQQDAIGAVDEDVLFARAKSLSISENVLYDHENLQQVQAEVLMGFYLLVISQVNRYGLQAFVDGKLSPCFSRVFHF